MFEAQQLFDIAADVGGDIRRRFRIWPEATFPHDRAVQASR
jgi:hypothetical protein